ncbi:MAG: DUF4388 domain-containing protein [Acidobacteriota bacterium]|nr:DUF4388 domain-containing protein [Acidobacteriota bacterium]
MPLAGTFDVIDFAELVDLLIRKRSTGRLQIRTESVLASIWLGAGQSVMAEVTGMNTLELKTKGKSLLEDICFDALKSTRGSFEFVPQDEVERLSDERSDLQEALDAARDRLERWRRLEPVIKSLEAVPRLAESLGGQITVDDDRWKVLVAIDGRRNVVSLARRLELEVLDFCEALQALIEQGAVEMHHPKGRVKNLPKVRLDRPENGQHIPVFVADDLISDPTPAAGAGFADGLPEGTPGDMHHEGVGDEVPPEAAPTGGHPDGVRVEVPPATVGAEGGPEGLRGEGPGRVPDERLAGDDTGRPGPPPFPLDPVGSGRADIAPGDGGRTNGDTNGSSDGDRNETGGTAPAMTTGPSATRPAHAAERRGHLRTRWW